MRTGDSVTVNISCDTQSGLELVTILVSRSGDMSQVRSLSWSVSGVIGSSSIFSHHSQVQHLTGWYTKTDSLLVLSIIIIMTSFSL